jgi:hypothetical protein
MLQQRRASLWWVSREMTDDDGGELGLGLARWESKRVVDCFKRAGRRWGRRRFGGSGW